MRKKHLREKSRKGILVPLLILIVAVAAAVVVFLCLFRFAGGHILAKNSLDDLRGKDISVEQYEEICAELGIRPRWDVPIGGERFDSASDSIIVSDFTMADIDSFGYIENLRYVDANAAGCYEEIMALKQNSPELEISYTVLLGQERIGCNEESYSLSSSLDFETLNTGLKYLPQLMELNLRAANLNADEENALFDAYPEILFVCDTDIVGQQLDGLSREISIDTAYDEAIKALCDNSRRLFSLEYIDFGDKLLSHEQYGALKSAYPEAEIKCSLEFYGVRVSSDAESLNLDDIQISDTSQFDTAVVFMPNLKTVYMSDCGLSDVELDALNNKYEHVRVVWTVYVKQFECRTDAIDFCVSRITNDYGMYTMKDDVINPIRYCTDLVTLDLGHMVYYNSDFVENMHDLRFLIMGDTNISDIKALENCKELYFLEIFLTDVTDLSPLFELKELRYLNVSYCPIEDYTQLFKFTWLDKLWFVHSNLTPEQQEEVRQALPDTEVCFWTSDGSSVDVVWRTSPGYYEMRDNLGMFYHFG